MIETNAKNLDLSASYIVRDAGDVMDISMGWACQVFPEVVAVVATENNDNTLDVLDDLMKKYSNLRVNMSPWNGRWDQTFQKSFDMAKTKWLVHIDTDEIYNDFDWSELIENCERDGIESFNFHRIDLAADLKRCVTRHLTPRGCCPALNSAPHIFGEDSFQHAGIKLGDRKQGYAGPPLDKYTNFHLTLVRTLIGLYYKGVIRGGYQPGGAACDINLANPILTQRKMSPDDHMFVVRHRVLEWKKFMNGTPNEHYTPLTDEMVESLFRWIPKNHKILSSLDEQLEDLKNETSKKKEYYL